MGRQCGPAPWAHMFPDVCGRFDFHTYSAPWRSMSSPYTRLQLQLDCITLISVALCSLGFCNMNIFTSYLWVWSCAFKCLKNILFIISILVWKKRYLIEELLHLDPSIQFSFCTLSSHGVLVWFFILRSWKIMKDIFLFSQAMWNNEKFLSFEATKLEIEPQFCNSLA